MYHANLTSDGQLDPGSVKAAVKLQVVVQVALHVLGDSTLHVSLAGQARG
jgi:hypothetical protein